MKYKRHFHYTDGQVVIRITAYRIPSQATEPKSGTWVVRELHDGEWAMPSLPEITWGILKKLEYLGCIYDC